MSTYEQWLHKEQMLSNLVQKSCFPQLLRMSMHSDSCLFSLSFGQVTKPIRIGSEVSVSKSLKMKGLFTKTAAAVGSSPNSIEVFE